HLDNTPRGLCWHSEVKGLWHDGHGRAGEGIARRMEQLARTSKHVRLVVNRVVEIKQRFGRGCSFARSRFGIGIKSRLGGDKPEGERHALIEMPEEIRWHLQGRMDNGTTGGLAEEHAVPVEECAAVFRRRQNQAPAASAAEIPVKALDAEQSGILNGHHLTLRLLRCSFRSEERRVGKGGKVRRAR